MSGRDTAVDVMKTIAVLAVLIGLSALMASGLVRVVQYDTLEHRIEDLERYTTDLQIEVKDLQDALGAMKPRVR